MATARKIYSRVASGAYNSTSSWSIISHSGASCTCIPTNGDTVYIGDNDSIYYAANLNINKTGSDPDMIIVSSDGILALTGSKSLSNTSGGRLHVYGVVRISNDLNLEAGSNTTIFSGGEVYVTDDVTISNGANVDIKSGGYLSVGDDFTNNNSSDGLNVDGTIDVGGDFDNGNNADITTTTGGTINVTGTATNSGTVFGSSTCSPSPCTYSTLPVELLFFNARKEEASVALYWATATETNNSYFTIERSRNGVVFEPIAKIKGVGNSNTIKRYEFNDKDFIKNTILYYRLKQTDFDGATETFHIVSIETKGLEEDKLLIYPNPLKQNTNVLQIETSKLKNKQITIFIIDVLGRVCYSSEQFVEEEKLQLNLQELLKEGIYSVVVKAGTETYTQRLIVN